MPTGIVVEAPQPDGTTLPSSSATGLRRSRAPGGYASAPLLRRPAVEPPGPQRRPARPADGALPVGRRAGVPARRRHRDVGPRPRIRACRPATPASTTAGLALLIDTDAPTRADAPIREVVHLTGAIEETDPLYGVAVTHLRLGRRPRRSPPEHDLSRTGWPATWSTASEGRRYTETFVDRPRPAGTGRTAGCGRAHRARRRLRRSSPIYLHTLAAGRLALAPRGRGLRPRPRSRRERVPRTPGPTGARRCRGGGGAAARRRPVRDQAYTVDPVRYLRHPRRQRIGGLPWWEYDGDDGDSIRFGDGTSASGRPPAARFDVTYRVTAGRPATSAAARSPPWTRRDERRRCSRRPTLRRDRRRRTRRRSCTRVASAPRSVPLTAVPGRAGRGLHEGRRGAGLGARRRHRDALDRQLADRLHHRPAEDGRGGHPSTSTSS